MAYTGVNLGNVKVSNRSAVLKLLNDQGPTSRKDIAASLGLTPASVTQICSDLIAGGVLVECDEVAGERRAGRRKVPVDINYRYRLVLTLCIEAQETCVAVSDLRGNLLNKKTLATNAQLAPAEFLQTLANEAKILMWECQVPKEMVLGVGVSIPGAVDRAAGASERAYRIWDERVELAAMLGAQLGLPVVVENNVKAFAKGEQVFGAGREHDSLLFVKWGPGVGSAAVIDGQIYDGLNYRGVEIGHLIVNKEGRLCRCGRHGCLETEVSTHAVVQKIQAAFSEESMPELWEIVGGDPEGISTRSIGACLAASDLALWQVMGAAIDELARATVNALTLLAPERAIVYGYMFGFPQVKDRFLAACAGYDASYDDQYILSSGLEEKRDFIGPLAVAVDELFLMGTGALEA